MRSAWIRHLFVNAGLVLGVFALFVGQAHAATSSASVIPNDTFWNRQWYLRQIHAPEAWTVTTGSRDVIVAVIDGGVDIDHPDLRGNIWTNKKEIPGDAQDNEGDELADDVHGWNFITDSGDVRPVRSDDQSEEAWSHGTMVAALIGARGNDNFGVAGVAWNVRIMPLVVLDADGEGDTEHVVRAIRYAVSHGASIINLSLIGFVYDETLERTIKNAADAGVLVVAATGNDGERIAGVNLDFMPAFPVCMDGERRAVLGVGGTDTLDQKAPYANYGFDCTDLSAPAQSLFVARPSYPHDPHATSAVPGYVDDMTGTSLAAPLVTGAAALIRSVRPEWTPSQIMRRLKETADSIDDGLIETYRGRLGTGRLNVARALAGITPAPSRAYVPVKPSAKRKKL